VSAADERYGENGIRVSGLSLSLGGSQILNNVSIEAAPGSFLCVVGRNGAGKSTLFQCVAGIHRNYAGGIFIGGRESGSLSARERSRLIAYVPQNSPGDIPYTAEEFMEMSRYPWRGVSSPKDDALAIAGAMEMTGTAGLSDRRLSSLSGGERQKVMIASAIAQGTCAILMDEPTTYLDYAHQAETMELMARINREHGVTMMVVTHDVNLAIGLAGSAAAISSGSVVWSGESRGLLDTDLLARIFGVSFRQYRSDDGFAYVAPEAR